MVGAFGLNPRLQGLMFISARSAPMAPAHCVPRGSYGLQNFEVLIESISKMLNFPNSQLIFSEVLPTSFRLTLATSAGRRQPPPHQPASAAAEPRESPRPLFRAPARLGEGPLWRLAQLHLGAPLPVHICGRGTALHEQQRVRALTSALLVIGFLCAAGSLSLRLMQTWLRVSLERSAVIL